MATTWNLMLEKLARATAELMATGILLGALVEVVETGMEPIPVGTAAPLDGEVELRVELAGL